VKGGGSTASAAASMFGKAAAAAAAKASAALAVACDKGKLVTEKACDVAKKAGDKVTAMAKKANAAADKIRQGVAAAQKVCDTAKAAASKAKGIVDKACSGDIAGAVGDLPTLPKPNPSPPANGACQCKKGEYCTKEKTCKACSTGDCPKGQKRTS
jgi:hypothetical protein